jgi:hypothetical protein
MMKGGGDNDCKQKRDYSIIEQEKLWSTSTDYDYCLVFKVHSKKKLGLSKIAARYCKKMIANGLELFLFYGDNNSHIFILIRSNVERLRSAADKTQHRMLLDEAVLEATCIAGNPEMNIAPINILHNPQECRFRPHELIYGSYRTALPENLYWRPGGCEHPFQ